MAASAVAAFALIGADHTPHTEEPPTAGRSGSGGDGALVGVQRASFSAAVVVGLPSGLGRAERLLEPFPVQAVRQPVPEPVLSPSLSPTAGAPSTAEPTKSVPAANQVRVLVGLPFRVGLRLLVGVRLAVREHVPVDQHLPRLRLRRPPRLLPAGQHVFFTAGQHVSVYFAVFPGGHWECLRLRGEHVNIG